MWNVRIEGMNRMRELKRGMNEVGSEFSHHSAPPHSSRHASSVKDRMKVRARPECVWRGGGVGEMGCVRWGGSGCGFVVGVSIGGSRPLVLVLGDGEMER